MCRLRLGHAQFVCEGKRSSLFVWNVRERERERLTTGFTRNLFAEKILEKLPTPCRFSEHGCGKILLKNDKLIHLKLCPFREVECPQYSCRKPVSLWKVFEHVGELHPDVELVSPGFEKIYHVSSLLVNDGRQSSNRL